MGGSSNRKIDLGVGLFARAHSLEVERMQPQNGWLPLSLFCFGTPTSSPFKFGYPVSKSLKIESSVRVTLRVEQE